MLLRLCLPVLAWAAAHATTPPPPAGQELRGQVALPPDAERPAGGLLVVELRETTTDRVLTEQRLPLEGAGPALPFRLQWAHPPTPRQPVLRARAALLARGRALWLSESVAVDPLARSSDLGVLTLARAPRALAFQTEIDCRIRRFVVGMDGDRLVLRDGDHLHALQPDAGAPDQRYVAVEDPTIFVQVQGTTAEVAVRGARYAGCSLLR
jgi:uncharacterized lipoprotein YbaY